MDLLTESINDTEYCLKFIDKNIDNIKAKNTCGRFLEVLSDPNNKFLVREEKAGIEENNYIYTFPGIKVYKNSYYGNHIDILKLNKGSHEPAEERIFQNILSDIQDNGIMLELGSYWCFYSMWFNKKIKNARNYCIEPSPIELDIGKKNCQLNNVHCDFTRGYIGSKVGVPREAGNVELLNLNDYFKEKNINYLDILHSDIQGAEFEMLISIKNFLKDKKIKYLFVSTHSNDLHYNCIKLLHECNYRIIADSNFDDETFCFDGIIVACCNDNDKFKKINLGSRKHTQILSKDSPIGKKIQKLPWVRKHHWG